MRFQLLSNIMGRVPICLDAHAPVLILNGNFGRLEPITFRDIRVLTKQFRKVFWIPYAAETFRENGSMIDAYAVRAMIHDKTDATCLTNDVVPYAEHTIVGTSGWWPGRGGAPATVNAWCSEDADFINQNCFVGSTLITAGCHYNRKPTTIIGGIVPNGMENFRLLTGRQQIITNDATAPNFNPNHVFEC